jgi:hypothetical protein
MKKILREWKRFIAENVTSDEQIRIDLGKKMNSVLFKSIDPSKNPEEYGDYGPDILKKYKYLHWSVHGTKAERERGEKPFRPEMGYKFVEQKVNHFIASLTSDEKRVLKADIPQLVSLLKKGDVPKFSVQIPVELTGHEGVDPSFRVPNVGRKSIDDWGMGGTLRNPAGENYIFYILDAIYNKLPASRSVEPATEQEIRHLYFMSETKEEFKTQSEPSKPSNRFSSLATSGMSYEEMVARLTGKK